MEGIHGARGAGHAHRPTAPPVHQDAALLARYKGELSISVAGRHKSDRAALLLLLLFVLSVEKIVCQNKIVRCSCSDPPKSTYKNEINMAACILLQVLSLTALQNLLLSCMTFGPYQTGWQPTSQYEWFVCVSVLDVRKYPHLVDTCTIFCPQLHHKRQSTQKKGINKNDQQDPSFLFSLTEKKRKIKCMPVKEVVDWLIIDIFLNPGNIQLAHLWNLAS